MQISWAPAVDATSYRIEAADAVDGPYRPLGVTQALTTREIGLSSHQTRWYRVAGLNDTGAGPFSAPVSGTTLVRWDVAVTPGILSLRLEWPVLPGAETYRPYCQRGGGGSLQFDTALTTYTFTAVDKNQHYGCEVFALGRAGQLEATPVHDVVPLPPLPGIAFNVTAAVGSRSIQLSWLEATDANSYQVERSCGGPGQPFVLLGTTATTGFADTTAPEFTPCLYRVRGIDVSGAGPESVLAVMTSGVPDQANLVVATGKVLVSTGEFPSQTFRSGASGQLMGIEVSASLADANAAVDFHDLEMMVWDGPVLLAARGFALPQPPCCSPPALAVETTGAGYADFSGLNVHVAVGEQLRFELRAQYFNNTFYELATTDKSYAAGTLSVDGAPVLSSDLAFKTFVKRSQDAALVPPPAPDLVAGVGAVLLGWDGVPGATGYVVLRGTNPSSLQEIGRPIQPFFVDRGLGAGTYFYAVESTNGSATSDASRPAGVSLPPALVDAENLGQGQGWARFGGFIDLLAGQTFTVGNTGTIVGIEVGLLEDDSLQSGARLFYNQMGLRLFDADGVVIANTIGSPAVPLPTCCVPVPLDADLILSGFFPLQTRVTAGQRLGFDLGAIGGGLYRVGLGPDTYSGGTATIGGQPASGDLFFKVILQ
jgi:hypothetical protein